jgi:asparagine synthase (glutamine-hydrolysing)
MSMAHGLESRVPFLDHPIVELAATMPANIKFQNGTLKQILLEAAHGELPAEIRDRKDKMGFPVPLDEWIKGDAREFVRDIFATQKARGRPWFDSDAILAGLGNEPKFGRKVWGLLSLELWLQTFVDDAARFRQMLVS